MSRLLTGSVAKHLGVPDPHRSKPPTRWLGEGESVACCAAQHDTSHADEPHCSRERGQAESSLDAHPATFGSCQHPSQVAVGKLSRLPEGVLWLRVSDEVDGAGEDPPAPVDRHARSVRTRSGHRDRENAGWKVQQWDNDAALVDPP
jgi:hypothetical protein